MDSSNGELISCLDESKVKNKSKRNDSLDKLDVVDNGSTDDSRVIINPSLDGDAIIGLSVNSQVELDITESECNLEATCSETNGKKRKKKKKKKKNKEDKEEAENDQNAQIDVQVDSFSINDDSANKNVCLELTVDTEKADLTKSRKKRMRKKQKLNASLVDEKVHDHVAKLDSINTVDTDEKADSKLGPDTELTKSQRKKLRKKQKLTGSITDVKSQVPLAELDLVKMDDNALTSDRQSDSPAGPSTSLMKHDNNGEGDLLLVEKENIQTHPAKGKLKKNRRSRNSSDPEEDVESITVDRQASSDSDKVRLSEIPKNEVERVQAVEFAPSVKVVENVLTEKISSNCSTDDLACDESNKEMEMKQDVDLDVHIKDCLPQVPHSPVGGRHIARSDKKLLILDVNGLLADIVPYVQMSHKADIVISHKSVFKRPFCDDFLQFCFEKFNVGVWSSRIKKNVDRVIEFLIGDSTNKLLFCWHQSHCTDTGFSTVENNSKPLVLKELRKLWDKLEPDLPWNKGEYDESNTLLLDDSPYKALRNPPHTAIFPHTYRYKDAGDSSLGPGGDLRMYLERLAEAPNVQDFVAQNPFGQRPITESNPSWGFYRKFLTDATCQSRDVATPGDAQ